MIIMTTECQKPSTTYEYDRPTSDHHRLNNFNIKYMYIQRYNCSVENTDSRIQNKKIIQYKRLQVNINAKLSPKSKILNYNIVYYKKKGMTQDPDPSTSRRWKK